jgi:eukaryotic translation initiation factor 2C
MSNQMITVPGRVLNAPHITFQKTVTPREGGWNLAGQKFNRRSTMRGVFSGFQIQIVNIEPRTKNFAACFDKVCQQLTSYGIKIEKTLTPSPPVMIEVLDRNNWDKIEEVLDSEFEVVAKKGIRWLWISIPFHDAYLYATLKKLGDTKYGIHTVVICDENAQKVVQRNLGGSTSNDLGLIGNEALKFCAKSGGLSWAMDPAGLRLVDSDTIVIGIDVTHPSPASQLRAPSIAAIVGSYDSQLSGWAADLRTQTSRVEMVEGLTSMMKGRLELFREKNKGRLPSKIIVYRDGVSEGQFKLVLNTEYPAMVAAFNELYGKRERHPRVSIIVSFCGTLLSILN